MNKILLVIQREYLTRIRKPSFWVLTLLVPVLVIALYAIPVLLATHSSEHAQVMVVDETRLFTDAFESSDQVTYLKAGSLEYAQQMLADSDMVKAIILIPARETTIPNDAFLYYHSKTPSLSLQSDVDRQLQTILRNNILLDVHNISAEDYNLISNTRITMHVRDLETGRDAFVEVRSVLGMMLALVIFVAIFSFGSLVMRGVVEEKTSRIVEVIVSSVRPFQLMMGKVVGIGLVGLTQFALWLLLSGIGLGTVQLSNADLFRQAREQQAPITQLATKGADATAQLQAAQEAPQVPEIVEGIASIDFGLIVPFFLIYFLFGYLLYASLFAAVGAIVDNDNDSQFTFPLTVPLILTMALIPVMMDQPSGPLATWLSIIPFTSPVAMMFRLPFGVPVVQMQLSVALLVLFFPLCIWVASRIYRGGILLFGKQVRWADLIHLLTGKI